MLIPMPGAERSYRVLLFVLGLAAMSYSLQQASISPVLPTVERVLDVDEATATWVQSAFLLSASVLTPIFGRFGDMFGQRKVLMLCMATYAAGTLICALSHSIELLIAGRLVAGAGGGVFPISAAIIRDELPRERVAGALGIFSGLLGIGGGVSVVGSGFVVEHLGYRWLFWLPLLMIGAAALGAFRVLPQVPGRARGRIDWLAVALMSSGLSLLLFAVTKASTWGWTAADTLTCAILAVLLVALWITRELRSSSPLVDMRMMAVRGVWTTNLAAFLFGAGLFSGSILVSHLAQAPRSTGYGFGTSVVGAGVILLPVTLGLCLVSIFTGRMERRFGSKRLLMAGSASGILAYVVLANLHGHRGTVMAGVAFIGVGVGLAYAALPNLIVGAVRQDQTGISIGMNTIMRTIGGAFGAQISATVLVAHTAPGAVHPGNSGFTVAFWIMAGAMALATVAALVVPDPRERERVLVRAPAPVAQPATRG
jgi:MFS family permease